MNGSSISGREWMAERRAKVGRGSPGHFFRLARRKQPSLPDYSDGGESGGPAHARRSGGLRILPRYRAVKPDGCSDHCGYDPFSKGASTSKGIQERPKEAPESPPCNHPGSSLRQRHGNSHCFRPPDMALLYEWSRLPGLRSGAFPKQPVTPQAARLKGLE